MDRNEFRRERISRDELHALRPKSNGMLAVTEDHILSILSALRARDDFFGPGLFHDPAWEIVLQLYAAELGSRHLTADDLSRLVRAPRSTLDRWIKALTVRGVVEEDKERVSVKLSGSGRRAIAQLAQRWTRAFVAI